MSACFRVRSIRQLPRNIRSGLTLMELVVVLAILAGLASILLPMFPNLLRRTHKVVDATQTSEMAKAIALHQGLFMSYPDGFDLLTSGTSATFPPYLPSDGGNVFGNYVTAGTLTSDELAALGRAGIRYVQPLASSVTPASNTEFHVTRNPYPTNDAPLADRIDLSSAAASGTNFAILNTAPGVITNHLLQALRAKDPTARFVVFGVGPRCSMVGQTIQDAPMSVPQNKDFTPDTLYSRVGVVFMVSGTEVGRSERARLVASVALEDDELESTEKDIGGYYEVARDPAL